MHHRAPRPRRSAAFCSPFSSAGRAVARLSGLLVLTLTLLAAAGVVLVVRDQATNRNGIRVAAVTRAEQTPVVASPGAQATGQAHGAVRQDTAGAASTATGSAAGTPSGTASATSAAQPEQHGESDHRREKAQQPAAVPNPNCSLIVPAQPTSATALATPYRLVATDPRAGACHETDADQSAFVEAAIIEPGTGQISVYHPLVVDQGAQPAAAPVPVPLPAGAVVGVWFGFNGDTLTLSGPGARDCVNGLPNSPFGQFAYCNAPAFFQAAQAAIAAHKLVVPELGTGSDGLPCPTTRDFAVVDQDQSDNLATAYRIVGGRMGQDTAGNSAGTKLTNGSDEGLLANAIDPALGCQPWKAPNLEAPGTTSPALALNELSAAAHQAQAGPEALVPVSDPMVKVGNAVSVQKTNLYRAGVDQPALPAGQTGEAYCQNLRSVTTLRLARDAALFRVAPAPNATAANLLRFLQTRHQGALSMLGC